MPKPITNSVIEMWKVEHLIPYDLNAKKHEKDQVAKIAQAIQRTGKFDQPIVVDQDGVIIKGHGRRLAALELGLREVPVIQHKDLSPDEVKAMRLNDNRVAISDIDTELLRLDVESFTADAETLLGGIFDERELEFVTAFDLGEVRDAAFVEDMDKVLEDQRVEIAEQHVSALAKRIPLFRAFGFKDISATEQIQVTRLMRIAEAKTGKSGSAALASFVESALAE